MSTRKELFALITQRTDRHRGDVAAGITDAAGWIARHLPVYALNLVLTSPTEMWALRYPDTHELYVRHRAVGGPHGDRHLDHAGSAHTVHTRSAQLARHPAVVVASERMDDDAGWHALEPGELLHVGQTLRTSSRIAIDAPPANLISLDQLTSVAAASQATR